MARVFTPATGDNLRQRQATAYRLLAVVVHGYLLGQTLGCVRLRAFFVKLYAQIRPRAVQLPVTQAQAAALVRAARRCAAWSRRRSAGEAAGEVRRRPRSRWDRPAGAGIRRGAGVPPSADDARSWPIDAVLALDEPTIYAGTATSGLSEFRTYDR